jgi:hypothetical protein
MNSEVSYRYLIATDLFIVLCGAMQLTSRFRGVQIVGGLICLCYLYSAYAWHKVDRLARRVALLEAAASPPTG